MGKVIGIDLGTTNSAMAVVGSDGSPVIIENAEGARTTPSIAALSKSNERLVGLLAKRQAVTNPKDTLFSVKRLIGRKWTDAEVQKDKGLLSYEIREASNGGVEIKLGDKWHAPEEISAMVLAKLKADAEMRLGEKITEAVITVPAYFDDAQRQATKNAGEIAGLTVKRIINEPTAAALAYGLNKQKNEQVVVYDFGGGTFDVSVLEVDFDSLGGDVKVLSTGGDTHLGGDDLDIRIQEYVISEYKKIEGLGLSKDSLALQRLKEAVERAKHELSSSVETTINLPYIAEGPKHLEMKLTRSKLEELVREFIDRAANITKETVKEAGLQISDIDEVILVGGQTRMPAIQESVKGIFGKEPHRGINPDEVVALGAAVQGGIFQGDVKDVLLLDVTPLTLAIETMGGIATPMIEKNTTIPFAKSQVFSTASDNQTSVEIHITQGERARADDNKTLAKFVLEGIPPSPRGVPQVEVTFDIDANGILNVKAADKATGKSQSVRIEAKTSLSKDEIERLKKEAVEAAETDKKIRELAEKRNMAENLIYTAEKSLKDAGDKVSAELRTSIETKVNDLKDALKGDDMNNIESKFEALSSELQKVGEAMYNKDNSNNANTNNETNGGDQNGNDNNAESPNSN